MAIHTIETAHGRVGAVELGEMFVMNPNIPSDAVDTLLHPDERTAEQVQAVAPDSGRIALSSVESN